MSEPKIVIGDQPHKHPQPGQPYKFKGPWPGGRRTLTRRLDESLQGFFRRCEDCIHARVRRPSSHAPPTRLHTRHTLVCVCGVQLEEIKAELANAAGAARSTTPPRRPKRGPDQGKGVSPKETKRSSAPQQQPSSEPPGCICIRAGTGLAHSPWARHPSWPPAALAALAAAAPAALRASS